MMMFAFVDSQKKNGGVRFAADLFGYDAGIGDVRVDDIDARQDHRKRFTAARIDLDDRHTDACAGEHFGKMQRDLAAGRRVRRHEDVRSRRRDI